MLSLCFALDLKSLLERRQAAALRGESLVNLISIIKNARYHVSYGKGYRGKLSLLALEPQQPKPPKDLARAAVPQPVPPLPHFLLARLQAHLLAACPHPAQL